MEIRKMLNGVSENDERKINEFLAKYPKLDEYKLLEMVKKELPTNNIVRTFCTIINNHWKELQKTNLLCWDITLYLDTIGYQGDKVDKYYLGLILNHIYTEYASAKEIYDLLNNLVEFLKDCEHTYKVFIDTLKRTKLGKKNIPYDVLLKIAKDDVEEDNKLDEQWERVKRLKEYERKNA